MGCNCGGTRTGMQTVWQLRQVGKQVREFATQHEAEQARTSDGGRGVVIRLQRKAS